MRSIVTVLAGCSCCIGWADARCEATTIHVPVDQPTIKAAVAAANTGDEIVLADGTYVGADNRNVDFLGKAITIRSANGASMCVIDCQGAGRGFVFKGLEGPSSVLKGVTIRNGVAPDPFLTSGGAVYVDGVATNPSPTIAECRFESNAAYRGAGLAATFGAAPSVSDCVFIDNKTPTGDASAQGGAVYMSGNFSDSIFKRCVFDGNTAGTGGGVYATNQSEPQFIECDFIDNSTTSAAWGGGAHVSTTAIVRFERCRFVGNVSAGGAGITAESGANPEIVGCLFSGNIAIAQGGGGVLLVGSPGAKLVNCSLAGNSAPAGFGGRAILVQGGQPSIANSICWGDTGIGAEIVVTGGGAPTVKFSIVQGGFAGMGNLNSNPLFIDPDGLDGMIGTLDDDLRVPSGSPAVDSGANASWTFVPALDLDGNPRFEDDPATPDSGVGTPPLIDRGCFELQPPSPCAGDIDGSGVVDGGDLGTMLASWGGAGSGDLDGNGVTDGADLGALLAAWGPCGAPQFE